MKHLILMIFIILSPISYASTTVITNIKEIMLDQDNGVKLYFKVTESTPTDGSCRTNQNWPYVLDISTEFGKSMYSAILAAYIGKLDIQVFGYGTCDIHNAVETVKRIELK